MSPSCDLGTCSMSWLDLDLDLDYVIEHPSDHWVCSPCFDIWHLKAQWRLQLCKRFPQAHCKNGNGKASILLWERRVFMARDICLMTKSNGILKLLPSPSCMFFGRLGDIPLQHVSVSHIHWFAVFASLTAFRFTKKIYPFFKKSAFLQVDSAHGKSQLHKLKIHYSCLQSCDPTPVSHLEKLVQGRLN